MRVYRNRRYEEEIVMLMWHKKGEQRVIETRKQKTQIQARHKITESANTDTHTETNKRLRARNMIHRKSSSGAELDKGFLPRSQTTNVGIPSFVLSGTKRAAAASAWALAMAAAICTRKRARKIESSVA